MASKLKKIICSIDSIHLEVKGDSGTSRNPHGIFSYFTPKFSDTSNYFKMVVDDHFAIREKYRDTKKIHLYNGLIIKCTSTGQNGVLRPDGTFAPGGLKYEVGGISSYNWKRAQNTQGILDFFSIIKQNWDDNIKFSRIDFAFDILQPKSSLIWKVMDKAKTKNFMNTDTLTFKSKKSRPSIKALIYDKGLKDQTYLDVTSSRPGTQTPI